MAWDLSIHVRIGSVKTPTRPYLPVAHDTGLFARDPSTAQFDHFDRQVSYFQGLYKSAGITPSDASMLARGAVLGQMLGYAVRDEPGLHRYDDIATAFIQKAIAGQAAYAQPLDFV